MAKPKSVYCKRCGEQIRVPIFCDPDWDGWDDSTPKHEEVEHSKADCDKALKKRKAKK